MELMPQLAFNGTCREAFEHYEKVLGGRITVMNSFGGNENRELPPGSIAAAPEKIRFAELRVGHFAISGNDVPADRFEPMQGFNIALHVESVTEARRIFDALAEGGRIAEPLAEVDWASLFGMVTDRFGTPWLVLALNSAPATE